MRIERPRGRWPLDPALPETLPQKGLVSSHYLGSPWLPGMSMLASLIELFFPSPIPFQRLQLSVCTAFLHYVEQGAYYMSTV